MAMMLHPFFVLGFLGILSLLSPGIFGLDLKYFVPPSKEASALYPDWAHDHWVWLSSGQANQQAEIDFVNGFLDRGIRVGAVDLDSGWSTGYNNFIWNTNKYPNATEMVDHFHSLGVRVILWVTSAINTDSSNFETAKENDYMLNNGRLIHWWHGNGGMLDYTNPDAVDWWHSQMDFVIDIGIDGWKCDGTDPYVLELGDPHGYGGPVTVREYANDYYSDFYFYTRSKNPDALIMSRPVDSYGDGYAAIYWKYSPRDVVFSGWVGDQNPTFYGLRNALRNMFHSAWDNYVGFGSDIGGYRCCDSKHGPPLPPQGRTKELFLRWAQMGAVCSLMENGGDNDHGPWMFDNQTVDIYRNFVNIHYELKPYLLNAGTTAYYSNVSIMKPVANRTDEAPSTWDYYLWSDIFVSPVVDNVTSQTIEFPDDKSCWVDWFNSSSVFCGPLKVHFKVPIDRFPIFQRQGSVLPLSVTTDDSSFGSSLSADALTVSIPLPCLPAKRHERTILREWKGPSQEIEYLLSAHEMVVRATSHERALLFRLSNTPSIPQSVSLNGVAVPRSIDAHPTASWYFDASRQLLWIHTGPSSPGLSMVINW